MEHVFSAILSRLTPGLVLIAVLVACGAESEPVSKPPPPAVTVAKPLVRTITVWDEYTGRLAAVDLVEVRARVSGYLQSVHFDDGTIVDKGDLLFVIDPRPYRAILHRAQAELEQAVARLELARNDRLRADRLAKSRAISAEELDARVQTERAAMGQVEAAEAIVEAAKLDLGFTRVRAPISGRISRELVTEGNLISGGSAGSTLLTTIVSLDPIYVYFTADEQSVLRYKRLAMGGERPSSRVAPKPVRIQLADETGFPHEGYMDFVDNRMDSATGTMLSRAVIPNPNYLLVPGLFARVQLVGRAGYRALLIPDAAIGTDQAQRFVYVVGEDNVVARRQVTLGEVHSGLRVIREGLAHNDDVIVKGIQRASAGSPVTPQPISLDSPNLSRQASRGSP
jgi:RND family efflux transporter MFP subunit